MRFRFTYPFLSVTEKKIVNSIIYNKKMKVNMARSLEIKNKTNRLVFIPLSPDENELSTITKKLCIQDETTLHDFLLESITLNLKKHNIHVGGNPNRQLLSFNVDLQQTYPKCSCGKPSTKHGLHLQSKREFSYCSKCFSSVLGRHDVKVWRWNDGEKMQ